MIMTESTAIFTGNLNEAQAERLGPYHAGLAESPPAPRYFEAMGWFDSPANAEEAAEVLAAAGYAFEQIPYLFDEINGFLIAPTVYGIITGYTNKPDEELIFRQLREITDPFGGCDASSCVSEKLDG
jgi:hypothetical protein